MQPPGCHVQPSFIPRDTSGVLVPSALMHWMCNGGTWTASTPSSEPGISEYCTPARPFLSCIFSRISAVCRWVRAMSWSGRDVPGAGTLAAFLQLLLPELLVRSILVCVDLRRDRLLTIRLSVHHGVALRYLARHMRQRSIAYPPPLPP